MEPILIRKATIADLDTLLHFEQGVISAERPYDSTLKGVPIRYLNQMGNKKAGVMHVLNNHHLT